jgi:hypothetical protein
MIKRLLVKKKETFSPQNELEEELQNFHFVSEISIDNSADIAKSSEQISMMRKL